ncbi:FAD/NAD(P)-binding protein [Glarea lozoyensis ATCC 20868]|uniref:FAD/NAD(P)-binding protein n=1 Tax=Glarea lozoyensis (strain ATCC 20868 / MF5171) TaxID=1116229 RepID=S3DXT0_GLAL2|nr:FAD/NAD(P)-binding protein [Glarea lozoyensis ATCC 20868]EPE31163.1 FAD/NAD(P)-binding protein [Glarea lozoyensis ATCC 20868]
MSTIVILGGSYVGLAVAHSLLKYTAKDVKGLKVVVVSPNTHLYWNLASVRAIVPGQMNDEKVFQEIAPGFAKYPSESYELIVGAATGVDPTSKTVTIKTASGTSEQKYTHLVIATGSRSEGNVPWKSNLEGSEKTKAVLHEYQEKVRNAKNIVVAGAGPTGVETAAELAFEYKGKKEVTLVTAGKTILPGLPPSVIKFATNQLASLGIKTIYSARVEAEFPSGNATELALSTGEKMTTDLYLPTIGVIPNTEFLPKSILGGRGDVQVDSFLKVKGVEGVWAAGDVVDIQAKQMAFAALQAKALAKNLDLVLKNQPPVKYSTDGPPMIAVTLGRSKGTGRRGNMKFPSIVVYFVKGKTLFTEKLPKYISGAEF